MTKLKVPVHCYISDDELNSAIEERLPIIIRGFDIGKCKETWSFEYVGKKGGDIPVKIHVSNEENMNFIDKNFCYKTLPFNELLYRIAGARPVSDYFLSSMELYYLRSLGNDARGKDVANIEKHWPELARDVILPTVCRTDQLFSTVLRISSAKVRMWTHYDVMDNILIQIRGRKQVTLWHPREVGNLYLTGDKSKVLDIKNYNDSNFPKFKNAVPYEGIMEEGDILFIPALWFHNTCALTPSIAVNAFWRNLDSDLYDSKDPYGNKDLLPAAKTLMGVKKAVKSLEELPYQYQSFYLRRAIEDLKERLRQVEQR